MTASSKQIALLLLGLVMLFTVIIAASLSQLDFKPGLPLPEIASSHVEIPAGESLPLVTISVNELIKVFLILIAAGFFFFLIVKIITAISWDYFKTFFQILVVILCIVGSVLFLIMLLPKTQSVNAAPIPLPTSTPLERSPLGQVPNSLLWLVGIGLLVGSVLLGIYIYTSSFRRKPPIIDQVGAEAEIAWQGLLAGLDFKDVILKCYLQMSLALASEGGLERETYMTVSEFEKLLESAGIPREPIHRLTLLFEAVRYGNWLPNKTDEKNARDSLEAIMIFCKQIKKGE
jgi:hypothetical protein